MLKVIDVDWVSGFTLELIFSDGCTGEADLTEDFQKDAFSHVTDFKRFSLTADGSLNWGGVELSAASLQATVGNKIAQPLKLNTAIDLYKRGCMSSGAAAEFVGDIDKYEFLHECRKRGVEPQTYESIDELLDEVDMLKEDLK